MRIKWFVTGWMLASTLWMTPPCHAEPITAILVGIGLSTATATAITSGIVTAVVGAVISFGIAALAGVISKPKNPKASAGSLGYDASSRLNISRNSVESHKIIYGQVRTSGPMVYVATSAQTVYVADVQSTILKKDNLLHMVIVLAAHPVEEIGTIYIDEEAITLDGDGYATGAYVTTYPRPGGTVRHVLIKKHLGAIDQEADADLVATIPEWTEAHQLKGLAYIYVRLQYYGYNTNVGGQKLWPNGVPQISAIVKGKKVYDPRTGLTAYSTNPALCIRDYLASTSYGLGVTNAELDDATFIASANNADELVTLADASQQKRYTCNGVIDTAAKPIDNLKDLTTSMAGVLPYVQGKFRCFSGSYSPPSISIDASWLAGELEITAKKPRNELFNAVKGVYVAPDKGWQPTDFPVVSNSTYQAQDGGYQILRDLELPFTTDVVEAQRIAKIALEQGRQGISFRAPMNYKALRLSIYDTVSVTIAQLGWDEKVFRVTQWELNLEGGFTVSFQEEAFESYDWNSGEQTTIDPAPDTNLPSLLTVDAPGNPVVTETLYETTDGSGVKTRADLSWGESTSGFIDFYLVQYKLDSEDEALYKQEPPARANFHTIRDLAPGVYNFRVQAINVRGGASDFATSTAEILGLTAPPADITGLTLNALNNQAHLSWNQVTDLDVKNGGYIRLRYAKGTSGTWPDGLDLGDALPGIATSAVVPLLSGTYMIKAYDSAGNESVTAASITTDLVNLLTMNAVATQTQHSGFTGAKTNMVVDSGDLILDDGGGPVSTASYVFSTYLDLGAVYNSRVMLDVESSVYDTASTFDAASGLFDARPGLFDGADIAGTKLEAYIKTTSSDPASASDPTDPDDPVWSSWRKFTVADFTARAFWAKIVITNSVDSNNIAISELALQVDVPDREEKFTSQSLASGGTTINYGKAFYSQPFFGITIQSTASGDTPSYTHVTSGGKWTGVTVQILNEGSGVARTVDLIVKGY